MDGRSPTALPSAAMSTKPSGILRRRLTKNRHLATADDFARVLLADPS